MDTDIVFDTASGFSETEQREILENIEALTRKDLITPAPEDRNLGAKKRGGKFPLLVNLAGAVLLIGGVLALFFFYRRDDSELRVGNAALGLTERKLIQEIRRENEAHLRDKEQEISDILSKLSGIDGDLQDLQVSLEKQMGEQEAELRQRMNREMEEERERLLNQNLSEAAVAEQMRISDEQRIARLNTELDAYRERLDAERQNTEHNLQNLQEEYRNSLSALQSERAGLLEASRIREANLKAQLEAKTGELTQRYEQNQEDLNLVREELRRLTDEQERSVLVERQMSGFYTLVQTHIHEGAPEKARETLNLMREFLETPAFQTVRAIQSQKEGYLAAINTLSIALEGLLSGAIPPAAPDPREGEELAALRQENTTQAQTIADQTREIEAYRSAGTDLTKTMREFEGTISSLRSQNAAHERDLGVLKNENSAQAQRISIQEQDLGALRTQNTSYAQTISAQERDLGALKNENTAQAQRIDTQERDLNALRTQTAAQTQQITTLRTTNTSLFQAMESLQKALDTAKELQETQRPAQ
jgi:septal ring factor EnvC (AmiA/AmiB activator)